MPLTDDDFNVGPAKYTMDSSPKKKTTSVVDAVDKQQKAIDDRVRGVLAGLNVSDTTPTVRPDALSPEAHRQMPQHLAALGNLEQRLGLRGNRDLADRGPRDAVETPTDDNDDGDLIEPKETTEVALYDVMDDIVPYENTVQWYPTNRLPGMRAELVQLLHDEVFSNYTNAAPDEIFAMATITHPAEKVAVMYKGLKEKGTFIADVSYDFNQSIEGYEALAEVYRYKGIEFLLVKDFAGYYIYAYDKKQSKLTGRNVAQIAERAYKAKRRRQKMNPLQ